MAIFPPLQIGRQALLAHQQAISVTGQNIANVNTPGYTRQRAVLSAISPAGTPFGRGVSVAGVEQSIDPFLEARRLATQSQLGFATTSRDLLERVQSVFPVQGPGVTSALDEFFAATEDLARNPEGSAERSNLLGRAQALAGQVRTTATGLADLQREADVRIQQGLRQANGLLGTIDQLNGEIVSAEIRGGVANDLRDQRREALGQLAGLLDIRTLEDSSGFVRVSTAGGQGLIVGPLKAQLGAAPDGTNLGLDGLPLSKAGIRDAGGNLVPLTNITGGEIGGLLELRDKTLPQNAAALDDFTTTLRDAVNAEQTNAAGTDLNGAVGTPFFGGTAAKDFTVLLSDPRTIAASRNGDPSNADGAKAIAAVGNSAHAALGNATLGSFFASLESDIGGQAATASQNATIAQNVSSAIEAQRDAVSGVSLEEEFTNLLQQQRAFQAATQLVQVSNRMLDDLFNSVR